MANDMQSFDFNALDSSALDETLTFLNSHDPSSLLPDPSLAGFDGFAEPMMDWLAAENPVWGPLANGNSPGGVTNALTDNSLLGGFQFSDPGCSGVENHPRGPYHSGSAAIPFDFGESR